MSLSRHRCTDLACCSWHAEQDCHKHHTQRACVVQLSAMSSTFAQCSLGRLKLAFCCLQGGCRAIIRINGFLVLHHVMFCTLTVPAFQPESLFMLKICIVGSCFATYEVLLYAALISCCTVPWADHLWSGTIRIHMPVADCNVHQPFCVWL